MALRGRLFCLSHPRCVAKHADADCVLVGPQIAYQRNKIMAQLPICLWPL